MTSSTSTQQTPIGSGFGASTTAEEVIAGHDLHGRTAVVTGGYSGLGLETVRHLVAAGARVIVPARRPDLAEANLAALTGVEVVACDLADLASIARAGEAVAALTARVDLFFATAGVMASPLFRVGPGWEGQARSQPPRPRRPHSPARAAAARAGRARGGLLLRRPLLVADPVGGPGLRRRVRQVGGVRPVEDGERSLRLGAWTGGGARTASGRSRCTRARS
ncbi:SDR family NAD(P)-dependent oxidoreductase [Nocardioides convexus]|uniref:SDR family NAD(P)-dependent oxidoreductase n=1 Tax=Nocardioides convexus TaxID=2712224 RepID=UPI002418AE3B|nr:SDR family NAD(P)-dependent oxidoreductase [Nocardioides convexus]